MNGIKGILNIRPIKCAKPLILLVLTCIYVGLSYYITKHSAGANRTVHHDLIIAAISTLIPLLIFFAGRVISCLFMPVLTFFFLANIYLALKYNIISFDMLVAIAGTNTHEALSMIKTVPIFVYGFVVILMFSIGFLCFRFSRFNYKAFLLCLFCVLSYLYVQQKRDPFSLMKGGTQNELFNSELLASELYGEVADGYIGNFLALMVLVGAPPHLQPVPQNVSDASIVGRAEPHVKNIILIIGESDFAGRHFLYSKQKELATPKQIELWREKKLCFISKAHSAANFTNNAVPMIMSFSDPQNPQKLSSEKNLVELAKDNGFYVSWISDVDASSFAGFHYGYISSFSDFLARGDHNAIQNSITPFQDMSLLVPIERQMQRQDASKFIVIHLNGSHQTYSDDFDQEDKEQLKAPYDDYDRSLHKTDRFIDRVNSLAQKYLKDYLIVYTPDHGEVVGEGHGSMYGGYDQYVIPVFILGKDNQNWCKEADSLRTKYGYFTSLMDKYLVLEMLGYRLSKESLDKEKQKDFVLHSDGKIYDYTHVPLRHK